VKLETTPPRGMRDVLPVEVELRDRAVSIILATYRRYGFCRIETPALENLRLLLQSGGGENEKLIFKVLKRGAKLDAAVSHEDELADLGLRFDLTVPLARYYAHNRAELPDPFKAVQIGPVWRAERPQKDRFRQFTQCDIDVLGEASGLAEIELILATSEALMSLGLENPRIRLNDRRILTAIASACGIPAPRHGDFFITLDKLDKLGRESVERELREAGLGADVVAKLFGLVSPSGGDGTSEATLDRLNRIGASVPGAREFVEGLATIVATVRGEAAGRFGIEFDPALVRGMGYYTGPIFEAMHAGYASSIGGGGRYATMLGRLLKQDLPACGFSIGFERVISILMQREQRGGAPRPAPSPLALLIESPDGLAEVLAEAGRLRRDGRSVSLMVKRKNVGRQLDDLARAGFGGYAMYRAGQGALEVKPLVARTEAPR